jgi:hypothetical protein
MILMFILASLITATAQVNQMSQKLITPPESTFFSTVLVEQTARVSTFSNGDLWPVAWSDDDYLYLANGDGWGFGATSPWADIVVNRLSGHPQESNLNGVRIAAGAILGPIWSDPERYNRKPTGMLSVEGALYLAVQDLNKDGPNSFNDAPAATILRSDDKGRTWAWNEESPMFSDYQFTTIMFLDYGKDSGDNLFDDYVYAYGLDYNWRDSFNDVVEDPTKLYLARMPKDAVQDRSRWEFYTGDLNGKASWSVPGDINARQPVLQDERRVYQHLLYPLSVSNLSVLSQGSVVYNKPLNRYLYTSWTEYTFEFYEAPTPWGPWKRFISKDFGLYPWTDNSYGGYATVIPSKFINGDGQEMWVSSSTFAGGVNNYKYSLRKLRVTPFQPTTPSNTPRLANLASQEHGQDATPISKAGPHYGNIHILNDGSRDGSEDSWNGEVKKEDYWGYTWSQAYNLNTLVYTTGRIDEGGGWFETFTVQVRQNFEWQEVDNLAVFPEYSEDASVLANTAFTLTFDGTWGDGVRIVGKPGGLGAFTSIAELEVYYLDPSATRTSSVKIMDAP